MRVEKTETGCHCNEINNSKKTMIWAHGFSLWSAGSTAGPMTRYKHPGRKVWWAEESCPPHSSQEAKTLRCEETLPRRAHTHT